ncbi:Regulatory protein LEU3 [Fusarium oxysporum f. sp. albedinis]|nr:Regulatory protein LEU3 [Fusarium oxysporum f. sp. albedinis]
MTVSWRGYLNNCCCSRIHSRNRASVTVVGCCGSPFFNRWAYQRIGVAFQFRLPNSLQGWSKIRLTPAWATKRLKITKSVVITLENVYIYIYIGSLLKKSYSLSHHQAILVLGAVIKDGVQIGVT